MQLDFRAIQEQVSFADVVNMLQLPMKKKPKQDADEPDQWRCACPACQSNNTRTLVITKGEGWYCHDAKIGGGQLRLVAHVLKLHTPSGKYDIRAAAQLVTDRLLTKEDPAPEPTKGQDKGQVTGQDDLAAKLAKVCADLDYTHPKIAELGLDETQARKLTIGYKRSGMFAGSVALPLFVDGRLVGFCGLHPEKGLKLPPKIAEQL